MVQSKGKKSSVNFKYYAHENWLLSLTSNRLSPTARHFPAKASLEPLDRGGMLCKLRRKERQRGESSTLTTPFIYKVSTRKEKRTHIYNNNLCIRILPELGLSNPPFTYYGQRDAF